MGCRYSAAAPLALVALAACAGQQQSCPSAAAPVVGAAAAGSTPVAEGRAEAGTAEREKIAVLPVDDGELFRSERAGLRELLLSELKKKLPEYDVVPLAEVDVELMPRANVETHCGDDEQSRSRRAFRRGWLATSVTHVMGISGKPEAIWVDLRSAVQTEKTLQAVWDPRLPRVERYRAAFAAMVIAPDAGGGLGLVGGIAAAPSSLTVGPLRLCERRGFENCAPETKAFADRAPALAQCLAGEDERDLDLVFESPSSCEVAYLDLPSAADSRREQCLCAALRSSAGSAAKAGRRKLSLHFEASDLAGKPRPELRVVESSANLHAESDWYDVRTIKDGKVVSTPVQRLGVDGLDAARAPLARCGAASQALVIADLDLNSTGTVQDVRFVGGPAPKQVAACLENALKRSTWACSEDGKAAKLRLALGWLD